MPYESCRQTSFCIRFYTCVNHPFTAIRKRSPDRTKYTFCFLIEEFDKFGVVDMFGVGLRSPTYKRFVRISYIIFFSFYLLFRCALYCALICALTVPLTNLKTALLLTFTVPLLCPYYVFYCAFFIVKFKFELSPY